MLPPANVDWRRHKTCCWTGWGPQVLRLLRCPGLKPALELYCATYVWRRTIKVYQRVIIHSFFDTCKSKATYFDELYEILASETDVGHARSVDGHLQSVVYSQWLHWNYLFHCQHWQVWKVLRTPSDLHASLQRQFVLFSTMYYH